MIKMQNCGNNLSPGVNNLSLYRIFSWTKPKSWIWHHIFNKYREIEGIQGIQTFFLEGEGSR